MSEHNALDVEMELLRMRREHEERKAQRVQALTIDIDTRLSELWATAWEPDSPLEDLLRASEDAPTLFGHFLRAAYGRGYCDRSRELGESGELHRAHGYSAP